MTQEQTRDYQTAAGHVDGDRMERYAEERLLGLRDANIESHIGSCPACEARLRAEVAVARRFRELNHL